MQYHWLLLIWCASIAAGEQEESVVLPHDMHVLIAKCYIENYKLPAAFFGNPKELINEKDKNQAIQRVRRMWGRALSLFASKQELGKGVIKLLIRAVKRNVDIRFSLRNMGMVFPLTPQPLSVCYSSIVLSNCMMNLYCADEQFTTLACSSHPDKCSTQCLLMNFVHNAAIPIEVLWPYIRDKQPALLNYDTATVRGWRHFETVSMEELMAFNERYKLHRQLFAQLKAPSISEEQLLSTLEACKAANISKYITDGDRVRPLVVACNRPICCPGSVIMALLQFRSEPAYIDQEMQDLGPTLDWALRDCAEVRDSIKKLMFVGRMHA